VHFSKILKKHGFDTLEACLKSDRRKRKVGHWALPRKVRKMLKEVYHYLNKRAGTSNSAAFTKRKFFYATVSAIALILLSGLMLSQVMSAIQISSTIPNVGTLKLNADIGVYWDANFTNRTTAINWGRLDPSIAKSFSVYIRNEGSYALTLSMSASNWSPSTASNYLTINWNYNGQTVNPNEYVGVTLTLTVSGDITGISNFSFDINLVGTE
jgi:hypothetical protein